MATDLLTAVTARYPQSEFPALWWQYRTWSSSRPLAGMRILDATPVFANTMAKYLALSAAGARLTVAVNPTLPSDSAVVAALPGLGVPVTSEPSGEFDIVLDCAGLHADVPSGFGYAELTRSGLDRYVASAKPVLSVDSGAIKRIETTLGTSDGFVRAMTSLGHPIPAGAAIVIFGLGKVGAGVAHAAARHGARITAVDPVPGQAERVAVKLGVTMSAVGPDDRALVLEAVEDAWCVVAATGVYAGLDSYADELSASSALLANMGAEDEFGPRMPPARALNGKFPVNFALPEPTLLRYLDATMALSNACAVELATSDLPPGLALPPVGVETELLRITREQGLITDEIDDLGGFT